jgi:hypothetical protein
MSYDNLSSVSQKTAKVKIIKNERDPPLFTGKLLIKFQNILRNTTQVIIRHRVPQMRSEMLMKATKIHIAILR